MPGLFLSGTGTAGVGHHCHHSYIATGDAKPHPQAWIKALYPLYQILGYEAAPLVIWSQQQKEELIQLPIALPVGIGIIEVNC